MKKYHFSVLIEQDEDGIYVATVPQLRGCHTQAKTLEELYPRIKEAVELCLEVQQQEDRTEPEQMSFVGAQQIEVSV